MNFFELNGEPEFDFLVLERKRKDPGERGTKRVPSREKELTASNYIVTFNFLA